MKIIVLSDIHANLEALEKVLSNVPTYDELYCLGDLVGYGPNPNEVVEALRARKPTIVLTGNHDYAVVTGDSSGFVDYAAKAIQWTRNRVTRENLAYLRSLQPSAKKTVANHILAMFHGSPRDPLNEYIFPGTPTPILKELLKLSGGDVLLQGHTHVPMYFRNGHAVLLNPGSVGQPRDGDARASYMIIDVDEDKVVHKIRRVQYEIDKTSKGILENGLPSFLAERLHMGV